MGHLNFSLGKVQYDNLIPSTFSLEAQIGVSIGASIVALIVLIIVLIYRSVGWGVGVFSQTLNYFKGINL